jgi:5-methylcytosine-specific restriction endonuclease McrA
MTRAAAKAAGLTRYFNGKPCPSEHVADRFVSSGACCECTQQAYAAKRKAHPELYREYCKASRTKNPEKLQAYKKAARDRKDPQAASRIAARQRDRDRRRPAESSGSETYASEMPCKYGHIGLRETSTYKCTTCYVATLKPEPADVITARAEKRAKRIERAAAKKSSENNRQAAMSAGITTYLGSPCRAGHDGVRWTSSYACVECSRHEEAKSEKTEYDRVYRGKNQEKLLLRAREWVRKNPEKRRSIAQNNHHRRRAQSKGGMTGAEFNAWKRSQDKVCHWCGIDCADNYHVDHYIALAKGGKHEASNLVIACQPCNSRKSAKDPERFKEELRAAGLFSRLITPINQEGAAV